MISRPLRYPHSHVAPLPVARACLALWGDDHSSTLRTTTTESSLSPLQQTIVSGGSSTAPVTLGCIHWRPSISNDGCMLLSPSDGITAHFEIPVRFRPSRTNVDAGALKIKQSTEDTKRGKKTETEKEQKNSTRRGTIGACEVSTAQHPSAL